MVPLVQMQLVAKAPGGVGAGADTLPHLPPGGNWSGNYQCQRSFSRGPRALGSLLSTVYDGSP